MFSYILGLKWSNNMKRIAKKINKKNDKVPHEKTTFELRQEHDSHQSREEEEYNNMLISLYSDAYSIAKEIASYTKEKYNYTMEIDEMVNMAIHIRRIQKMQKRGNWDV